MRQASNIYVIGISAIAFLASSCGVETNATQTTASQDVSAMEKHPKKESSSSPPNPSALPSTVETISVGKMADVSSDLGKSTQTDRQTKGKNENVSDKAESIVKNTIINPQLKIHSIPPINSLRKNQQDEVTKSLAIEKSTKVDTPSKDCPSFPCLVLNVNPNNRKSEYGNPIYYLLGYLKPQSQPSFTLNAVTGRGNTQKRDRYQSGTEAPLPDGLYSVIPTIVRGTIPEVGGTMLPIFPKRGFDRRMRRTELGIHWDPSFNKDPKEDGTSGCIGLTKKEDYIRVRNFVFQHRPKVLKVNIDSSDI